MKTNSQSIKSVKGTRDFYPEDLALRNWIYQNVRKVSESYGYQEWDGPFLETLELYAAKSGEELVKEQSFVFPDRGGDLVALRPELTPSLARMIVQRQRQLTYPLRWWSWGPFWRYERPQKGRAREFFQWNIDLIGVDSPAADAEMVAIAAGFLRQTGLNPEQARLLVNDRRLIESELRRLEVSQDIFQDVFRLIDRRDKLTPEAWEANAREIGLNSGQIDGLVKTITDDNLWMKSASLESFFDIISKLDGFEYVHFAPNIIRGLAYYTGIVFEVWDQDGEFRAILGGGRYDNLVSDVGGETLPAIGFAMGDMVISLVLKKFGCLPEGLGDSPAPVLVTIFDDESTALSLAIAAQLRQAGINAACYPEPAKLAKQIKYGDRMGMRVAVIIGPDELAEQQVALKNLRTGEQVAVPQAELVSAVRQMLESSPPS